MLIMRHEEKKVSIAGEVLYDAPVLNPVANYVAIYDIDTKNECVWTCHAES